MRCSDCGSLKHEIESCDFVARACREGWALAAKLEKDNKDLKETVKKLKGTGKTSG